MPPKAVREVRKPRPAHRCCRRSLAPAARDRCPPMNSRRPGALVAPDPCFGLATRLPAPPLVGGTGHVVTSGALPEDLMGRMPRWANLTAASLPLRLHPCLCTPDLLPLPLYPCLC